MLYGEYTSAGALVREYVYLNGQLLAQVDAGSPEVLTYIHTDHLGTPRFGTNTAGTQVWTWTSDAFGVGAPSGSRTVNLRMAGQYFDSESGLFYNWNRYYNPAIGRYVSVDPIGLGGGLNPFSYAEASPVMYTDPEGKFAAAAEILIMIAGTTFLVPQACDAACRADLAKQLAATSQSMPTPISHDQCMAATAGLGPIAGLVCAQFANCPTATAPGVDGPEGATTNEMGKESKKSGKEKASDIPSYAKGYQRDPNENCHDFALSIMEQEFGKNDPRYWDRRAGSDYYKIVKNCERKGK